MSISEYPVVKTSEAIVAEGQTTIAISRNDGQKGKSGLCCVVPVLSESVLALVFNSAEGKVWFAGKIDELRSAVASAANKKRNSIDSELLGIGNLLANIRSENAAGRLTSDVIGQWFDCEMKLPICRRLQEKNAGISADKLEKITDSYKAKFALLSGRNPKFSDADRSALVAALDLLGDDPSLMSERIAMKLADSQGEEDLAALI